MNNFNQAWNARRAARRAGADAPIDLRQVRAWYASNVQLYGFTELKDLYAQRVIQVDIQLLQTAISDAARFSSQQLDSMLSQLVTVVQTHASRYQLPGAGTLQPLDETGNPLPIIPGGTYDVAFPMLRAGTAWGSDRVSRVKMTVGDVARYTMDALLKDVDWMIRHILAAIFTNVTYTYTDPAYGVLTVQPLANADAVTYVRTDGTVSANTHFLAQAAAIDDTHDPYSAIYTELAHHPGNTGPFVAYIPTNLVATTQALSAFAEIRFSNEIYSTTNPTMSNPVQDINANAYALGVNDVGLGTRILGTVDGMLIIEWSRLPNNYIIAHARGANDVVGMRQEPEPELQGFFPEYFSPDGNLMTTRMLRMAGFGILNRIGVVVDYVGVSGTYAIPSGYTAPLPA